MDQLFAKQTYFLTDLKLDKQQQKKHKMSRYLTDVTANYNSSKKNSGKSFKNAKERQKDKLIKDAALFRKMNDNFGKSGLASKVAPPPRKRPD